MRRIHHKRAVALNVLSIAGVWCVVLGFSACGSEEDSSEPSEGSLGSACKLDDATSCAAELRCTAHDDGALCTYPAGAACSPDSDALINDGCSDDAVCKVPETTEIEGEAGAGNEAGDAICLTQQGGACDPDSAHCDGDLVCAELESGEFRCFEPLVFRGQISDSSDGSPIAEAQVIAIDDEGVAVSDVAESDADGNYELDVPVVRDEDGAPVDSTFTLRAAAQLYQPFPAGVRVALPISTEEATLDDGRYMIDSALTDMTLIPLPDADLHSISGRVVPLAASGSEVGGVLIVAKGSAGALSAISDKSGQFTVFNVPSGSFDLAGYAANIQIEGESVSVEDSDLVDVELEELDDATTTVSGNIQIVNAPGGAVTSVILVVEDTFDPNAARGEVPRGLRAPKSGAPDVSGNFVIEQVPAGKYVVLAAYENDDLVRDPDTSIGGTSFVTVEVLADQDEVALTESFKVTEALEVIAPGRDGPEAVDDKPTLTWADDSSEEWYEVRVFNAFGDEVWNDLMVPSVSGNAQVTVDYDGPLDPGMYYQFRVSSWNQSGNSDPAPLSTSEDLRGVFYMPAP